MGSETIPGVAQGFALGPLLCFIDWTR